MIHNRVVSLGCLWDGEQSITNNWLPSNRYNILLLTKITKHFHGIFVRNQEKQLPEATCTKVWMKSSWNKWSQIPSARGFELRRTLRGRSLTWLLFQHFSSASFVKIFEKSLKRKKSHFWYFVWKLWMNEFCIYIAHFLCEYIQMRFTTLCGGLCQTALWRSSQSF